MNDHLPTWQDKIRFARVHDAEARRLRESAERSHCPAQEFGGYQCTADIEREPGRAHRYDARELPEGVSWA